jgi:Flp pilus assembly protein TadD
VDWDGWFLFETTTWTPKVRLSRGPTGPGLGLAFAPDSRTAGYGDNAGTVTLVDVETGRELVRFEDPEQARLDGMAFTPDGSHLVTTFVDRPYLRIWDLRAIRRRLADLHLDWDPPARFDIHDVARSYPPIPKPFQVDPGPLDPWPTDGAEPPAGSVERTTRAIEVNPNDARAHHERAHALAKLKRYEEAIADFTAALNASPSNAHLLAFRGAAQARLNRIGEAIADWEAALRLKLDPIDREPLALVFNDLCWTAAAAPASRGKPARALALARLTAELIPDRAFYLNTLGVLEYRAGLLAEAVATLEKSLAAGNGEFDAFDLFPLAMAHQRLGHRETARDCFDRAVRWLGNEQGLSERYARDLAAFRAEAQALLDVPPPELPADVFVPEPPDEP